MDITHITSLLGGIALFLYGMSIMGAGLEKLAGGKMQGVLQKLTSSTIKGVIFGTLITGVIQSSAGTVVVSTISQLDTFFGFPQIAVVSSKISAMCLDSVSISASYCGISNSFL